MLAALIGVATFYGVMLWLLRGRKLPVLVMRVWFTLHMVIALFIINAGCHIVSFFAYFLHVIPVSTAQSLSRCTKQAVFKLGFGPLVPHVKFVMMPGSLPLSAVQEGAVCACHCSFFDSLFFLMAAPFAFLWKGRTFLKSSLMDLPIFGYVLRCTGYFPVYFANERSASFSVNKEKQAAVGVDVDNWLKKGGSICFFPEGVMNRSPEVLTDFRLGSFNTILHHKLSLHYLVYYGNSEVWSPSWKGLPGFPADIYVYVGKYEYDAEKEDAVTLSIGLHDEMQKRLDDMLVTRKEREYKPWWKPSKTETAEKTVAQ